jgi:hypothetical protein
MAACRIGRPHSLYGPEHAITIFTLENTDINSDDCCTISSTTNIEDVNFVSSHPISVATDDNLALLRPHIAMLRFE